MQKPKRNRVVGEKRLIWQIKERQSLWLTLTTIQVMMLVQKM